MKYIMAMYLCSWVAVAQADCEVQIKELRAQIDSGQYSLDVRRKVNAHLQPLLQQRSDLNPMGDAACKREMQVAREILAGNGVKVAKK